MIKNRQMIIVSVLLLANPAIAETVNVKYRGPVPLDTFDCPALKRSSVVKRICYDAAKSYLIVKLRSTYYHYCSVQPSLFKKWVQAPSLGRFYNQQVKVSSNGGRYDCRTKPVPKY